MIELAVGNPAENSLYTICEDDSYFCCEANSEVKEVIKPDDIWGEYNLQNAQAFCEKNYGGTVVIHETEFEAINSKELSDQRAIEYNNYLEID